MENKFIVVLVSCPSTENALKVKECLLNSKLAACINIVKDVKSFFWWDGKINSSEELLLIIKSKKQLFRQLVDTVKINHEYDVPEIIALPIVDGNEEYLNWVGTNTKQ
ncbi:MAG: divalent-cation tolerance protein CutA [Candidatus Gygaella obscura]|nr:divalent-cation tolerance protein CutA [Candidatus Gygaella obscura]